MPIYEESVPAYKTYTDTSVDPKVEAKAKEKHGDDWSKYDAATQKGILTALSPKKTAVTPDVPLLKTLGALITEASERAKALSAARKEAVQVLIGGTTDIEEVKSIKEAIAPVSYTTLLDKWLDGVELDPKVKSFLETEKKKAQATNQANKNKSSAANT